MNGLDQSGIADVDAVARPVFSLITESTFVGEAEAHAHRKAQLMYVVSGVLTIRAAKGVWTVPPHCALWIPGGVPHSGRLSGALRIANLYLEPALVDAFNQQCGIVFVQPLLREIILRFGTEAPFNADDPGREARLVAVLLDELAAAPLEPIHLPMPRDRRLLRMTEALVENPAMRFTIGEWGARVGASNRTLTRLFQQEMGMSFVRWRQQLHVGLALQRLGQGETVTNIALDLGYESVSAFISMFRRMLGTTPARYFGEGAATAGQGERKILGRDEDAGRGRTRSATPGKVVPLRRP